MKMRTLGQRQWPWFCALRGFAALFPWPVIASTASAAAAVRSTRDVLARLGRPRLSVLLCESTGGSEAHFLVSRTRAGRRPIVSADSRPKTVFEEGGEGAAVVTEDAPRRPGLLAALTADGCGCFSPVAAAFDPSCAPGVLFLALLSIREILVRGGLPEGEAVIDVLLWWVEGGPRRSLAPRLLTTPKRAERWTGGRCRMAFFW